MGPLPGRALAAVAAVAVLAVGGGHLFLARRRARPGLVPGWPPPQLVRDGSLCGSRADGSGAACLPTGMLLTRGGRRPPAP